METTELEIRPEQQMRLATDVAGVCKEIVNKTAITIQNRKYVKAEGWMSIAAAHGCLLSAVDVKAVDGGISATGQVVRASDGKILATAEGFVGDDEPMWAGRPAYARRAMAQTRAMSRAARSAFAHIVVMMDSGLSTTPAEEVPAEGFPEREVSAPKNGNGSGHASSPFFFKEGDQIPKGHDFWNLTHEEQAQCMPPNCRRAKQANGIWVVEQKEVF